LFLITGDSVGKYTQGIYRLMINDKSNEIHSNHILSKLWCFCWKIRSKYQL